MRDLVAIDHCNILLLQKSRNCTLASRNTPRQTNNNHCACQALQFIRFVSTSGESLVAVNLCAVKPVFIDSLRSGKSECRLL